MPDRQVNDFKQVQNAIQVYVKCKSKWLDPPYLIQMFL